MEMTVLMPLWTLHNIWLKRLIFLEQKEGKGGPQIL